MNKEQIFHFELRRQTLFPWEPPCPYKIDESSVLYAKERILELADTLGATLDEFEKHTRGGAFGDGQRDAIEVLRGFVNGMRGVERLHECI